MSAPSDTTDSTGPKATTPPDCRLSPHAIFTECPQCGGGMRPEHAHFRCSSCGWRDSCCD